MAVYYFDSSGLVKRYAQETGTAWVMGITTPAAGHDIYLVRITGPEIVAALFRKVRTREITQADAIRAATNFKTDFQTQYQIVELTIGVADRAMTLAEQHGLRGYDAVQLAAALELHAVRHRMGLPPLTFVSADSALNTAGQTEGLMVADPNAHP